MLVLENLLDDAKKMKDRYEQDYLSSHKQTLVLQAQLDAVRTGKSHGDGSVSPIEFQQGGKGLTTLSLVHSPEATIALRQRLNETVEELDQVKKSLTELEVSRTTLPRSPPALQADVHVPFLRSRRSSTLPSLRSSPSPSLTVRPLSP